MGEHRPATADDPSPNASSKSCRRESRRSRPGAPCAPHSFHIAETCPRGVRVGEVGPGCGGTAHRRAYPWEPLLVRKPAPAVAQGTSGSFARLSGIDPPGFMANARTENQQVTVVPCKRGRPTRSWAESRTVVQAGKPAPAWGRRGMPALPGKARRPRTSVDSEPCVPHAGGGSRCGDGNGAPDPPGRNPSHASSPGRVRRGSKIRTSPARSDPARSDPARSDAGRHPPRPSPMSERRSPRHGEPPRGPRAADEPRAAAAAAVRGSSTWYRHRGRRPAFAAAARGQAMSRAMHTATAVFYPSADDRPMAESDAQLAVMLYLLTALRMRYRDRADVFVGGGPVRVLRAGQPRRGAGAGRDGGVRRGQARGRPARELQAVGGADGSALRARGALAQHLEGGPRRQARGLRLARGARVLALRPERQARGGAAARDAPGRRRLPGACAREVAARTRPQQGRTRGTHGAQCGAGARRVRGARTAGCACATR